MWTWLYDEKRVISASRPPRSRGIQPWISNKKTLPTPSARRSTHNTPVLLNGEGRAPSQPPANPAGTKTWAACSREHSNQQSPHDLQPEQLLRRSHKAYTPLYPTICPFAGNDLGHELGAGAAGGPPKAETQGIAKQLAAFSGAGGRPIGRANANALAAKGNANEGWWRNHWARAVIWGRCRSPGAVRVWAGRRGYQESNWGAVSCSLKLMNHFFP